MKQDESKDLKNQATKKKKNQYHPAFCAAMELELREDKEHLTFEKEYNLNTKPNSIDFLVINVNDSIKVKSDLGAIFRKHNLFEFKSPKDTLDFKVYQRTMGYAYLYAAYDEKKISEDDITISFIRNSYPRNLIKWFGENGFEIIRYKSGIYHIKKANHIDMQIIVTKELADTYIWINKLTSGLEKKDLIKINDEAGKLKDEKDLLNAESVIDLSYKLNVSEEYVKEMNGMGYIRDALKDMAEDMAKDMAKDMAQDMAQDMAKKEVEEKTRNLNNELKLEKEKNSKLQKELDELKEWAKKNMSKIAAL